MDIRSALTFYKRQHPDFRTLNVRITLGSFLGNLTQPYNQVYARELGASPLELGYLSSVGSAFAAAFALPGGFLADRCGRKKLYVLGSAFGLITPLSYFLAPSWIWIVPAFIFSYVMIALRESAYQAIYAGSVRSEDRGRAFGIGSMLTSVPVILAPIVAVQIMRNPRTLTPRVIRPLYLIQLVGLILLLGYVYFRLSKDPGKLSSIRSAFTARDRLYLMPFVIIPPAACLAIGALKGISLPALLPPAGLIAIACGIAASSWRGRTVQGKNAELRHELREILGTPGVKAWLAMKGTGSFAMGLANPFWLVFAAYVVGVSPVGLALMVSLRTLLKLLSSVPWGFASDAKGRKFTLLLGRSFMHAGIICFILGSNQWWLILAYALMGVADGSASVWTVIRMELVPARARSSMASLDHFVWYLPMTFSAIVGGILYAIDPKMMFILCLLIDAGLRMPLVAFKVPETVNDREAQRAKG